MINVEYLFILKDEGQEENNIDKLIFPASLGVFWCVVVKVPKRFKFLDRLFSVCASG